MQIVITDEMVADFIREDSGNPTPERLAEMFDNIEGIVIDKALNMFLTEYEIQWGIQEEKRVISD